MEICRDPEVHRDLETLISKRDAWIKYFPSELRDPEKKIGRKSVTTKWMENTPHEHRETDVCMNSQRM